MKDFLKNWRNYPALLIIITLIAVLLFRECTRPKPCENSIQIVYDTIPGDTVPTIEKIPMPYPVATYLPGNIEYIYNDTTKLYQKYRALVRLFYAINVYVDTVKNDSNALIVLADSVTQNRLRSRILAFENRRPQITQTIIPKERIKVFVGLSIGRSLNEFGLMPQILIETKKSFLLGAGYDVLNKNLYVSVNYKLHFKK